MNCPMASWIRPDRSGSSIEMVSNAGITSVTLSPGSSMYETGCLDTLRFFTIVKGCRSSSHRVSSMSSGQGSGWSCQRQMSKRSTVEKEYKKELQIHARDEGCRSNSAHKTAKSRLQVVVPIFPVSVTPTSLSLKTTCASWNILNLAVRLMN